MAYAQALIQNDTSISETIRTQIRSMMDAHAAWVFVETVTISTHNYDVYRCLGTSNGVVDFYLIVRATVTPGTSSVDVRMAELYDSATDLADQIAPTFTSTARTPNATDGTYDIAPVALSHTDFFNTSLTLNSTATEYYFSLTDKRAVFATRVGTSPYALYAGLFDPFHPSDTVPLCIFIPQQSSNSGSFTRNIATKGTSTTYAFSTSNNAAQAILTTTFWSAVGSTPHWYMNNSHHLAPVLLSAFGPTQGGSRGWTYDLLIPSGNTSIAVGDTITIGAQTHVYIGGSCWLPTGV